MFVNFTISDIQKNESGSEVFKRLWIARVDGRLIQVGLVGASRMSRWR